MISWFAPRALPAKFVDYENHRTIGTMINTNAYITTLVLVGFLVLHYGLQTESKRLRFASIIVFLMTCYGIFISFSRAGWLAGILALVGLAAMYPRFILKTAMVIIPVFALVAGLFLQGQIGWASQRFMSDQSERSALSRVPVFAAAFRMFQIKPVFGWGYGNFDRFDRQFQSPTVGSVAGDNKDHASHNFFLSLIAEQGVVGTLLYLGPLFYWLVQSIKNFGSFRRNGFWSRKILVIFWMTMLSHVIVYNFANMRVVFALGCWWLVLGLIAHFNTSRQSTLVQELARVKSSTRPRLGMQRRLRA
jgi:O-antigen ligase